MATLPGNELIFSDVIHGLIGDKKILPGLPEFLPSTSFSQVKENNWFNRPPIFDFASYNKLGLIGR
jgi:hypothetical protein